MSVSVCPADEVRASADQVWSLLRDPVRLDAWWDARLLRATSSGPFAPGQHLEARARGLFPARLRLDVVAVDDAQRRLQITAHLPLGIVNHATITVATLGPERCRLQFG